MTIWIKRFLVYQRNACKSIIDDRGSGRMTYAKKKIKPFAEHDLRVTPQHAGSKLLGSDPKAQGENVQKHNKESSGKGSQ